MMRNLKTLGLTVVAVLAMSAFATSAVQAVNTTFTPLNGAATTISGAQTGTHEWTVGNRVFTCGTSTFAGNIAGNSTEVTITPTYANCDTKPVFGISFPITVTMNSCYFTLTGSGTLSAGKYGVDLHIECTTPGDEIVIHVYKKAPHNAENDICTETIKPQTPHASSNTLFAQNAGSSPTEDVVLDLNTVKTTATIHGTLCGGTATTDQEFESEVHGIITYKGEQGGSQVNLTVSD